MAKTTKKTYKKAPVRANNASQEKKTKARRPKYKDDMRTAYDIGYARGWEDAYELPKRIGAKTFAAKGYKRGAHNRKRSDNYISQYKRRG